MFAKWLFGLDVNEKIMTASYNETLSTMFSKSVRNDIMETKADESKIVYSDIFHKTKIKAGDGAMNLWSLEGGYNNYLATSPGGTATGFGASIIIIDDLIKNAEEAFNDMVLEKHWEWFCFTGDTMVNTINGQEKISDIKVGSKLMTYNHKKCIIEEKEVVRIGNKKSTIYRLEFDNGETIECTGNHKFYTTKGYKSIEEILHSMSIEIEAEKSILFGRMQKEKNEIESKNYELQTMQKGNSFRESEQTEHILFYGLPTSKQSGKFEGKICSVGKVEGVFKERTSVLPKMYEKRKLTRTSHKSRFKGQFIRKLNSSMSIVPYSLSQVTRLSENDVRTVYDIELKDNHNFFANNMLVHNCNTMLSRLEEGGKIIIIMTRWSSKDLAGRALNHFSEEGKKMRHINLKAMQDDGTMLCDEVLSEKSYLSKTRAMSPEIAAANYQQEPIDVKGRLYTSLKTYNYEDKPRFKQIKNYTDTADTGSDYLCSINYGVTFDNEAYILDVLYTNEGMEITEPKHAKMLFENEVNLADIESNNGGLGYARSVERILKSTYNSNKTVIKTFHQSKNKQARILSNSTWVMEHIYFPEDWRYKWPEFHKAITEYQKSGKNKHDDAPDALTGVAEMASKRDFMEFG